MILVTLVFECNRVVHHHLFGEFKGDFYMKPLHKTIHLKIFDAELYELTAQNVAF